MSAFRFNSFRPGLITADQAAELNRLARWVELLLSMNVTPPLQYSVGIGGVALSTSDNPVQVGRQDGTEIGADGYWDFTLVSWDARNEVWRDSHVVKAKDANEILSEDTEDMYFKLLPTQSSSEGDTLFVVAEQESTGGSVTSATDEVDWSGSGETISSSGITDLQLNRHLMDNGVLSFNGSDQAVIEESGLHSITAHISIGNSTGNALGIDLFLTAGTYETRSHAYTVAAGANAWLFSGHIFGHLSAGTVISWQSIASGSSLTGQGRFLSVTRVS